MKTLLLLSVVCLVNISTLHSQTTSSAKMNLQGMVEDFDSALVAGDTVTLKKLTHASLTMGHSNGWLQNRKDLLTTLASGYVDYVSIHLVAPPTLHFQGESMAVSRRDIDVAGVVNATDFNVKLNVLEHWIFEENQWKLVARQSVDRME